MKHTGNYVKVWFSSPEGEETARLVIPVGKLDDGIAEVSRMFPYTEAGKMANFHVSPEFATYQQALLWTGE